MKFRPFGLNLSQSTQQGGNFENKIEYRVNRNETKNGNF